VFGIILEMCGGRRMNRRTKQRNVPIHVTLPHHLIESFDNVLTFKESRSKKIAMLMKNYLAREDSNLQLMTTLEVLEFIQFRFKKDSAEDVLIQSLIRLLGE
jgi:metal-responsive CopG/Arc/MetJ family transcriptional regulator